VAARVVAICAASWWRLSPSGGFCRIANSRVSSSADGADDSAETAEELDGGLAEGAEGVAFLGAGREGAGAASAAGARRGITSAISLWAKARKSASNWPGSSLESPGLKTIRAIPICFARDWRAEPRLSVIISTGGRRFILPRRFTTSKPPWNEEPPEVGIP